MDISADLEIVNGVVYLTLWHDKGKSVFALVNGVFVPTDGASIGAIQDLLPDIPVTA